MLGFILYLVIINAASLLIMRTDKIRARRGRLRIREATLFAMALWGGSLGCLMGMYIFRHKTRKRRFRLGMPLILAAQILLTVLLHL